MIKDNATNQNQPNQELSVQKESFNKKPIADELPTVSQFQGALYNKILGYNGGGHKKDGGIEGVWNMIDPLFKIDNKHRKKLSKSAFRKAVSRLNSSKKNSLNEKLAFGTKGNIVLLMNVFEILGIKSLFDLNLYKGYFQKPNIDGTIFGIYNDTKILDQKIDDLSLAIERLNSRSSRLSDLKICYDSNNIFRRIDEIINNKIINDPLSGHSDFYEILSTISKIDIKGLEYFYNLLIDYQRYFLNDKLLFKYYQFLKSEDIKEYLLNTKENDQNIIIYPIFILFFFLKINKRFLSIMLNRGSFVLAENDKNTKVLPKGMNVGSYLCDLNSRFYDIIKNFLMSLDEFKDKIPIDTNFYSLFNNLGKEYINIFFTILYQQVKYDKDKLYKYLTEIDDLTFENFHLKLVLGMAELFVVSADNINKLDKIYEDIEQYKSKFSNIIREI